MSYYLYSGWREFDWLYWVHPSVHVSVTHRLEMTIQGKLSDLCLGERFRFPKVPR